MVSACSGRPGKRFRSTLDAERDDQLVIGRSTGTRRKPCTTVTVFLAKSMPMTSAWRIWTPRSNMRERRHRVGGVDGGGGDLGQQRLEHEIVVVVDQLDVEPVGAAARELLGGKHAAEAAAENENFLLFHGHQTLPFMAFAGIPTPIGCRASQKSEDARKLGCPDF